MASHRLMPDATDEALPGASKDLHMPPAAFMDSTTLEPRVSWPPREFRGVPSSRRRGLSERRIVLYADCRPG
jgi:hypothetical protein